MGELEDLLAQKHESAAEEQDEAEREATRRSAEEQRSIAEGTDLVGQFRRLARAAGLEPDAVEPVELEVVLAVSTGFRSSRWQERTSAPAHGVGVVRLWAVSDTYRLTEEGQVFKRDKPPLLGQRGSSQEAPRVELVGFTLHPPKATDEVGWATNVATDSYDRIYLKEGLADYLVRRGVGR